jgi:hypothetical protein
MDELAAEDGHVARQQVADEGIEVLKEINRGRNSMGRALKGERSEAARLSPAFPRGDDRRLIPPRR